MACPICRRVYCDHTPDERGQSAEYVMQDANSHHLFSSDGRAIRVTEREFRKHQIEPIRVFLHNEPRDEAEKYVMRANELAKTMKIDVRLEIGENFDPFGFSTSPSKNVGVYMVRQRDSQPLPEKFCRMIKIVPGFI